MDAQRVEFAQQKKSENVVEIGVGERDAGDRRVARALSRMQFGRGFDLRPQVRRRAQQKPRSAVLPDRDLRLRARLAAECTGSHSATICAGAVPLRKRASGRRSKNLYPHLS